MVTSIPPYDALLIQSFGGPEGPEDVLPFLRNVTRGRGVPEERLAQVAEHYQHFGGVSPINSQTRALVMAVRADLGLHGIDLPVFWGNRNWRPYLTDTLAEMAAQGVRRALALPTSGFASYSACRQYHDDVARAQQSLLESGVGAPAVPLVERLRHFCHHEGFISAVADCVVAAYNQLRTGPGTTPQADGHPSGAAGAAEPVPEPWPRLVFTAHSIPTAMNLTSGRFPGGGYEQQLLQACALVADQVALRLGRAESLRAGRKAAARGPDVPEWDLAWQSRSGPPTQPWLEPDVNDHLRHLAATGVTSLVVCPIGFVSDHVEVLWDLDHELADTAAQLGVRMARAGTVSTHPAFVAMIRELVSERLSGAAEAFTCPRDCCLPADSYERAHRRSH